jgi:uncharacterized protein (DUF2062 family)
MREEASMWLAANQHLESALPGEWTALMVTVVVAGLVGGLVLAVTCVLHGRGVVRRARSRQRHSLKA